MKSTNSSKVTHVISTPKWLKWMIVFFSLITVSTLLILIVIISVGIKTKDQMMESFTPDSIGLMIQQSIPKDMLQETVVELVSSPQVAAAFEQTIFNFLAQSMRGIEKRSINDVTCPGVTDGELCNKMDGMCKQLRRCVGTQNVTECMSFGWKALYLCNYENIS